MLNFMNKSVEYDAIRENVPWIVIYWQEWLGVVEQDDRYRFYADSWPLLLPAFAWGRCFLELVVQCPFPICRLLSWSPNSFLCGHDPFVNSNDQRHIVRYVDQPKNFVIYSNFNRFRHLSTFSCWVKSSSRNFWFIILLQKYPEVL